MSGKQKVLYWDTCVFLAWIKNETCWPEDVSKGIEQSIEQWRSRLIVIATSSITMLEVLSSQLSKEHNDAFAKVFSDPHLQLIDVDRRIAVKAHAIRSHYDHREFKPDGSQVGKIMGMGDAIHLATAIHFDVSEFQTLDGAGKRKRKFDLLTLDGNVAGARLPIKLPNYVPPSEPLHGEVIGVTGQQHDLFGMDSYEVGDQETELGLPKARGSVRGDAEDQGEATKEQALQEPEGE